MDQPGSPNRERTEKTEYYSFSSKTGNESWQTCRHTAKDSSIKINPEESITTAHDSQQQKLLRIRKLLQGWSSQRLDLAGTLNYLP